MLKVIGSAAMALGLVVFAGCGDGHDRSSQNSGNPATKTPEVPPLDPNAKPYPLDTCVVSGQKLGSMGEPVRVNHKGQEFKLCCKGCDKKFYAEPDKYLEKVAAAKK